MDYTTLGIVIDRPERQKGLTTSHLYQQLDPFASELSVSYNTQTTYLQYYNKVM